MIKMSPWFEKAWNEVKDDPETLRTQLSLEITDQLWARMQELGLTQSDVAKRLGLSQPYVARIMSYETNISLLTLVKLAKALELRVEMLKFAPAEAESAIPTPKTKRAKTKRTSRAILA